MSEFGGQGGGGGGSGFGGGTGGDPPQNPNYPEPPAGGTPRRPRPSDAELWKRRAQAAEARLAELEKRLAECERLLAQAREALDAAERRRTIERELASQGAIDLETAVMLTEAAVSQMPDPDVAAVVMDLRRRKPFLFRVGTPRTAGAMSGAPTAIAPRDAGGDAAADAADDARRSGDRQALLRYLRLRRGA